MPKHLPTMVGDGDDEDDTRLMVDETWLVEEALLLE